MKKLISKLVLGTAVLTAVFSLAACGRENKDWKAEREREVKQQEVQSEKEDKQKESGDKTQSKKKNTLYGSVADYVNSDEMQSALNNLKSSLQEGMSIDITAEGENKLVYVFTYQSIAHTEGDGMTDALAQAVSAQDATFQQTANAIKPFVECEGVIVEIRYVDMNGAVIFSKEYTAE